MEAFDDTTSNNEPTAEELSLLLDRSYKWIGDIIALHRSEYDMQTATLSVTTPEAEAKYRLGELQVKELSDTEIEVSLHESSNPKSEDATVEYYKISFMPDGALGLSATGTQRDRMEELQNRGVTDEQYREAFHTEQKRLSKLLKPATPAEIQRLGYILEVAIYGKDLSDFRQLEQQFEPHVDELFKALQDENENHPE